jgi:hypothetical protein
VCMSGLLADILLPVFYQWPAFARLAEPKLLACQPKLAFAKLRRTTSALDSERKLERETGFEPATSTLARSHSTTELFPLFGPSAEPPWYYSLDGGASRGR